MIVPMKKTALFVGLNDRDEALKVLREIGVLHVTAGKTSSSDTAKLESRLAAADRALSKIQAVTPTEPPPKKSPESIIAEILELDEELEAYLLKKEEVESRIAVFRKWSNVSLDSIHSLQASGVSVRLYSLHKDRYRGQDEERDDLYRVGSDADNILLAHISSDEGEELPFQKEYLPEESRETLRDKRRDVDERLMILRRRLATMGEYASRLTNHRERLERELHCARVKAGMGGTDEICYIEGFLPVDAVERVRAAADKHSWAYVFEDAQDDETPTLIRNPRWVSIIDPVFKFLGTVPGYREHDISLWFLLFFTLFFAMLIGDAGYGLVFLIATVAAQKKMKKAPRQPFILLYVLCAGALVWGVLSGTYFGSAALGAHPLLRSLVIEEIASFSREGMLNSSKESTQFMMGICFLIGAVHLTLAHLTAAWKKINSLRCLGDFGWVLILWGLYFLVRTLIFKDPFPGAAGAILAAGAVVALVFTNYQAKILKGIQETVIQLPLALIGGFSDIVSYMRLFAVGYTAVVLAHSFNNMAGDACGVSVLLAALVLFLGHALNLALSAMGVVVHGIRLKMLEFAGHIGNEWTGMEYDPFRENDANEQGGT